MHLPSFLLFSFFCQSRKKQNQEARFKTKNLSLEFDNQFVGDSICNV